MTPLARRERARSLSPLSGTSTSQSDTVEHESTSSNILQSPFPPSISTQHARSFSHLTAPTSPTHEIRGEKETSFIDLRLCRPSSRKLFNHPLAPPPSFSYPQTSTLSLLTLTGERTVFSKSYFEQLSSTSQFGEFMDVSPSSQLARETSRRRMKLLDKREKVWREGGLRNENEMDLDGSLQMRRSMIAWIWNADLRKSHIELSTSMRHLAVVLLTLFYADLDLLQPSPSSVPPSQDLNAQNAQLDSTMKNSQSSSGDTLTPGEFDVVKTALAALALAVKDFTPPLYAFDYSSYIKVLPVFVRYEELVKLERDILQSPSINYGIPITPLDYLFELSISIPFFGQLRQEKEDIWRAILDGVPELLRCATESGDSRFITVRPKVLISAILVIAVESLSPSLFTSSTFSTPSTSPSPTPSPPTLNENEAMDQDYEDDIAYSIALQNESDLLLKKRIKSTPTPVSYLSYRHLLAHGYDPTLDEEMEIIERAGTEFAADGETKGGEISRWVEGVEGDYPTPASEESEEGCAEDEIVELANVVLVTLFEELDLVEAEIEECLIWLRELHFA